MPKSESRSNLVSKKWLDLIVAIGILAFAILIYLPSFQAPFHFDDLEAIVNNHYLRIPDLSLASLKSAAFQDFKHNRPLTNLSLGLNFYFNQLNPFGYHLVNFIFLIFTALGIRLVLGNFLIRLGFDPFRSRLASWLITFLWLAHPLNTQATTYIVQRHTSFAGAFSVWTFYFFQLGKNRTKTRPLFFFLSALSALLALLSKETALPLPLLIFLFDLYFYQNLPKGWLKKNWKPILALLIFYLLAGVIFLRPEMTTKLGTDLTLQAYSFRQRILLEPAVLLWYPFLILFPFPQFLSLEHFFIFSGSGFEIAIYLFAWALLLVLVLLAFFQARGWKIFSFVVLWYLGQLSVEALPLPIDLANEHRLYLALLSVLAPAVAFLILPLKKNQLVVGWLILVGLFFGWFSFKRNLVWQNRERLWKDAVSKSPDLPRAWSNYCSALSEADHCEQAFRVCQKALALNPELADVHNALGICYFKAGEIARAEEGFLRAGELGKENYGIPYFNLGLIASLRQENESAVKWYLKALERNPRDSQAHYNLALTYHKLKQEEDYLRELGEALKFRPEWTEARIKLAQALVERGRCSEAKKLLQSAPAFDPRFALILRACQ